MNLVMAEYLEVNFIGVILLVTMLICRKRYHNGEQSDDNRHFTRMLVYNLLILLADNGIYVMRDHPGAGFVLLNHAFCQIFFILHAWFCYEWSRYALYRLYPRHQYRRWEKLALLAPAAVNTVLVALTPLTGWVYTISAQDNVYRRGQFVWVSFVAALAYWLVSSVIIVRESLHPRQIREPGEYRALLIFPLPPLIGNLLQLRFYGMSIVWVATAVSVLILFINMQNDLLSRDSLTGLYNRGRCNAQLNWELSHLHLSEDLLFVAMIDLDHFKQINDCCGHLAGDAALKLVGKVLRRNTRKSDFAGRFGGDEFLLIGHFKCAEDVERLFVRIEHALSSASEAKNSDYTVSLSIGYTVCRPGEAHTMDTVLNMADQKMYAAKIKKRDLCRHL